MAATRVAIRMRTAAIQNQKTSSRIWWSASAARAAVILLFGLLAGRTASAEVIFVAAGTNLQSALNRAQPGDIIELQAGATFTGNFVLPAKAGSGFITVRSSTPDGLLPGPSARIGPEVEPLLARIASRVSVPTLRTAPGTHHWLLLGLVLQGGGGSSEVIQLGSGASAQDTLAEVPHDLVLDRVIVRGNPEGQKRGIALNSAATTIRNCYIVDIKLPAQEAQAIAGWNGPGPYLIENNYIEASGVNVLFGGAEPFIPNLVPSDITFRRNHVTKPTEWRDGPWVVKNLLELKNARRVVIEGNVLEHNWPGGQAGYAVLFTVRASGRRATWSTVEQVLFQNNVLRQTAAGINILGFDTNAVSQQTHGIVIRNNLFDEIGGPEWGGNGTFLQVGDEPADITVDHNTIIQTGNIVTAYGGTSSAPRPISGFRFTNNITLHNDYGIFGSGAGVGNPAIARYFPDGQITANVLAGGPASLYPPGNAFPPVEALTGEFTNAAARDYRLRSGSALLTAGTDGLPLGVNFDELNQALGGGECQATGPTGPEAPTSHMVQTLGTSVRLSWAPVAGATSYILEAGSAPGAADLLVTNVGAVTSLLTAAPAAVYYTRVRAVGRCGTSAPSNEVAFALGLGAGIAPCAGPPPPPTPLAAQTAGQAVHLAWAQSPGAASYRLEAGSAPGLQNLFAGDVGAATTLDTAAPAGVYFTRVRAVNSCGPSAPSNEISFALGCTAPQAPGGLVYSKAAGVLTLAWSRSPGAQSYRLVAGTAPGLADALNIDVGPATHQQFSLAGVPPGTYFVRLVAVGPCGVSAPSNEVAIPVP